MSFVDVVRPSSRAKGVAFDAFVVLLASCLMGLLSQVELFVPFSPVPITLQSFGVMIIAASLGSKRGVVALLSYLAEGALGLPFFAGGAGGILHFAGPTAGYLLGFVPAAYVMGYFFERGWKENVFKCGAVLSLGTIMILACGALWLSCLVGVKQALIWGISPFLIGALLKGVAALSVISPTAKLFHAHDRHLS